MRWCCWNNTKNIVDVVLPGHIMSLANAVIGDHAVMDWNLEVKTVTAERKAKRMETGVSVKQTLADEFAHAIFGSLRPSTLHT